LKDYVIIVTISSQKIFAQFVERSEMIARIFAQIVVVNLRNRMKLKFKKFKRV